MHQLRQAGVSDDLAVQVVLLAGRDRRAAVENGVRNGAVVFLRLDEGADDTASDDDVQDDLLQRFADALVLAILVSLHSIFEQRLAAVLGEVDADHVGMIQLIVHRRK